MEQIRQPLSFLAWDRLSNEGFESFEFGSNERPFESFIQIEPIQFRYIHVPFWASEQLTLRIVIKMRLLDKNKDVLFKERIQTDGDPYTLEEWSGQEGLLLNTKMEQAYQELADQIVASIQANNALLLGEVKASH